MENNKLQRISENQLLEQLNIPDFRHLTKDHVLQLASNIHRLDPEVAKKVLEQFPEFNKAALDGLSSFKDITIDILNREDKSTADFVRICDREIDILESCLQDDLSFEQKCDILDRIEKIREDVSEHIKEKRRFHFSALVTAGLAIVSVLTVLTQALGGDTNIQRALPDNRNNTNNNQNRYQRPNQYSNQRRTK